MIEKNIEINSKLIIFLKKNYIDFKICIWILLGKW